MQISFDFLEKFNGFPAKWAFLGVDVDGGGSWGYFINAVDIVLIGTFTNWE